MNVRLLSFGIEFEFPRFNNIRIIANAILILLSLAAFFYGLNLPTGSEGGGVFIYLPNFQLLCH